MATLTSLCPELLHSILCRLNYFSLLSLSFTSKKFLQFVNPIIYHTHERCLYEPQGWPIFHPPIKWQQQMSRHPDLAALVKSVNLWSRSDDLSSDVAAHVLSANPLEVIRLPKLPNLEVLEIDYLLLSNWYFEVVDGDQEEDALRRGAWSAFENLKRVHFRNKFDVEAMKYPPHFEMLFPVFQVSSLEKIEMVLPEPGDLHWTESLSNYNLPNLRTLRLVHSQASVQTLSKILATTPNLRTLEYNFVQDLDKLGWHATYREEHYEEWDDLKIALEQVQGSLRELIISVAYFYDEHFDRGSVYPQWSDELWERRGWIGSLQAFTELERLEIPLPVLLGWNPDFRSRKLQDVLPSGVKELCLRDDLVDTYRWARYPWTPWEAHFRDSEFHFARTVDCSPVIEQLRDYLTSLTERHPYSNQLVFETLSLTQTQGRYWPPSDVREVAQLCREANVEGVFLGQASSRFGEDNRVVELTVHDPEWTVEMVNEASSSLQFQAFQLCYIHIPRRTFMHRFCGATRPQKLEWSLDWPPARPVRSGVAT